MSRRRAQLTATCTGSAATGGQRHPRDTTLFKHDLAAGTREDRTFGESRHAGEFLYVVDPERHASEDGGWLLGLVHDNATERLQLVVLDAADVTGPIVASVHLPRRITHPARGLWSPSPHGACPYSPARRILRPGAPDI